MLPIEKFIDSSNRSPDPTTARPTQAMASKNVERLLALLQNPFQTRYFISCDASPKRVSSRQHVIQCMTRVQYPGFWISDLGRRLTLSEAALLQGFRPHDILGTNVPEHELRKMLGNSMSCTLMQALFHAIFTQGLLGQQNTISGGRLSFSIQSGDLRTHIAHASPPISGKLLAFKLQYGTGNPDPFFTKHLRYQAPASRRGKVVQSEMGDQGEFVGIPEGPLRRPRRDTEWTPKRKFTSVSAGGGQRIRSIGYHV